MKVAIITEAAGGPLALATTAFVSALAEGLITNGAEVLVVGTTADKAAWFPETLGSCDSIAPWLDPPRARLTDALSAATTGVLGPSTSGCAEPSADEWYQELLLDRALRAFAGVDRGGALIVYPRSYAVHRAAVRVADRIGWRVVAFANEALSDNQIDPCTRDDYVRCIVQHHDGVWAVSEYLAEYWCNAGIRSDQIIIDPTIVRSALYEVPQGTGAPYSAVYIGNLAHREIDYLLDIAGLVHQEVRSFRLTIYGDALPVRRLELERAIRDHELDDVVRVEASVPPEQVPEALARSRFALLPRSSGVFSKAGFPNKLGEYLASGRSTVVTRVGDIPEYLTNGVDAVLVAPDDVAAFAEAVVRILTDDVLADAISEKGRQTALRFRSDAVGARLLAFIETLPVKEPVSTSAVTFGRRRGFLRVPLLYIPAAKRLVVRVLRALHLKSPDPGSR